MALALVTSVYVLILVWVSWSYLRGRDPLLRAAMGMFACVAMLFVLGLVRVFVDTPPRAVTVVAIVVLLAKPLFTLRLVGSLRPVRAWWWPAALAAWVLTVVPVLAWSTATLPRPQLWPGAIVFFAVEVAAACLLGAEARRRGGAARIRLWCAAAGTGLFGAAVLMAAGGRVTAVEARGLAVACGVLYLLAFVPPRWIRRIWAQGAAYAVARRLLAVPPDEPAARTWHSYCEGAVDVLGADAVAVLMPATPQTVRVVGHAGAPLADLQCTTEGFDELLSGQGTIDALAGWNHPPAVAVAFAQASNTRYVTVAPVPSAQSQGGLLMLNRHRRLFAEDDIAAFTELAVQAAALAERAQALAERQRLAVIVESSHDAIIGKTLALALVL